MHTHFRLIRAWAHTHSQWLHNHYLQMGTLFLCFFGVLSLWMYMLQDLLHHKIGVLSPQIHTWVSTGFLCLIFTFHGAGLRRCTLWLDTECWWSFHTQVGGNPKESQRIKCILHFFFYLVLTLATVLLCIWVVESRPLLHWSIFSLCSMLLGYGSAKATRRHVGFSTQPPQIPASPRGALVWSLLHPLFFPNQIRWITLYLLLNLGTGYIAYKNLPIFVGVLYTFCLALLPIWKLTQQLSYNLHYARWESQHGISDHTYLQALYLCTGGIGLLGGSTCTFGWWMGAQAGGSLSATMDILLMGVYAAPLWVLSTSWLQLDPRTPTLPFLISLLAGLLFSSALYATPWAWIGFPLLYRYGTQSQLGRNRL